MIVAELRRIQRAGKLRITANALINAGHTGLASAIHKYIGSFDRARRLARIPSPGRLSPHTIERWDEDSVIAEIRERHRADQPLAYKSAPSKLVDAGVFYCGSWKNAIELANLDYAAIRRSNASWTREALIEALRRGARSKRTGVGADGPVPQAVWLAARREFGSIRVALAAAGIEPRAVLRRVARSDRELAREVRQLARERPKITAGALRTHPLGRVMARRFGTIEQGLEALAIRWRPRRGRSWTRRK